MAKLDDYISKFAAADQLTDIQQRLIPQTLPGTYTKTITFHFLPQAGSSQPRMKAKVEEYRKLLDEKYDETNRIYTDGVVDGFTPLQHI